MRVWNRSKVVKKIHNGCCWDSRRNAVYVLFDPNWTSIDFAITLYYTYQASYPMYPSTHIISTKSWRIMYDIICLVQIKEQTWLMQKCRFNIRFWIPVGYALFRSCAHLNRSAYFRMTFWSRQFHYKLMFNSSLDCITEQ